MPENYITLSPGPKLAITDVPCECGEITLVITSDFVGFMGDAPCSEDWGECPTCGKEFKQHEINKRFVET